MAKKKKERKLIMPTLSGQSDLCTLIEGSHNNIIIILIYTSYKILIMSVIIVTIDYSMTKE